MNPLENPLTEVLINKPGKKKWPDCRSMVNVVFLDGEVREYEISASSHLSKYLVEQASETGILCFIDKRQKASLSIPVANIREWSLKEIEEAPAEPAPAEPAPAEPAPEAADADQAVMDNWLKTAFKIQLSRNDLLDAVEVFPCGRTTTEIVKQRAIGIVRRELQEHHPNDIVNRSTKKWLEVKRCGPQVVTFIRAALFNLRKQNR